MEALGYREIPGRTRPQNLETRRRNRAATRGGFDRNARKNGLTLVGYFAWHISRGIFRASNLQDLIYSFLVTAPLLLRSICCVFEISRCRTSREPDLPARVVTPS